MTTALRSPFRRKLTYCAHLFKALTRQHHQELIPLLEKYIPRDGTVIDVGAHAGQFTKLFAKLAPEGRVYSFEPGSYALSIISRVIRLRKLKNVQLFPMGLSDTATEQVLHMPIKSSGALGFGLSHIGGGDTSGRATVTENITLTTLDSFAEQQSLKRVDFIKADIEGWELHMLRGAAKALARYRPVLLLEVEDKSLKRAGDSAAALLAFMDGAGYAAFDCEFATGALTPLVAGNFTASNAIFLPREKQFG